jgi:hypothetical protein
MAVTKKSKIKSIILFCISSPSGEIKGATNAGNKKII